MMLDFAKLDLGSKERWRAITALQPRALEDLGKVRSGPGLIPLAPFLWIALCDNMRVLLVGELGGIRFSPDEVAEIADMIRPVAPRLAEALDEEAELARQVDFTRHHQELLDLEASDE